MLRVKVLKHKRAKGKRSSNASSARPPLTGSWDSMGTLTLTRFAELIQVTQSLREILQGETFACTVTGCSSSFPSLKAFRRHVAEHRCKILHAAKVKSFHFRGVSHPFECPQCGLRFDRKSQLGYHIEKNHEQVSFAR